MKFINLSLFRWITNAQSFLGDAPVSNDYLIQEDGFSLFQEGGTDRIII